MSGRPVVKGEDVELGALAGSFFYDPLGYVMTFFPWNDYEPIQMVPWQSTDINPATNMRLCDQMERYRKRFPQAKFGPDFWACEFLREWGQDITRSNFDGHTTVDPLYYATASGHGIGKSVLSAWIIKFIMDTRPFSHGTVTANTAEQLKTKTWAELGKWHKISLTEDWFDYNSGRGAMNLSHKDHKEAWRCDAQTCREENSEAFAGQHAANATSFYLFDEASAVPDAIYEVREGGTTDGEPMVFDFGNPTRNSGHFFEACAGRFRHRYKVRSIDSRTVWLPNKRRIKEWEDDYGTDSDFFKVRVRGMFPAAGSNQFIPTDAVELAQSRDVVPDKYAPLLIGVDVARFGDNESVIYPRVGWDARTWPIKRYQGVDTVQLTGHVIEMIREFRVLGLECSGLFVDGGGIGGAVVDQLRSYGYNVTEVQFGGSATNKQTYRYKSDEMWGNMKDAMNKLSIPANNQVNGVDLRTDLTQREFAYTVLGNKINLESKRDMIKRGIQSPDLADALALTFAEEVAPRVTLDQNLMAQPTVISEYDPLETSF
jgi:hypothetical protein